MPTVNELRSQIADEIGLSLTNDTAALDRALNRALRLIVSETGCLKGTPASIAGDSSTVDLDLASLSGLRAIESVYLLTGGAYVPVSQSTVSSVIAARTRSGVSQYAWEGGSTLMLDGPVGAANSLYIRWGKSPTAIAANGAESTITDNGVPMEFQEDLLAGLAMVYILEGYEGDETRASYYRQLTNEAMARFKRHLVHRGGDELPNPRGASHFHTADPLRIR